MAALIYAASLAPLNQVVRLHILARIYSMSSQRRAIPPGVPGSLGLSTHRIWRLRPEHISPCCLEGMAAVAAGYRWRIVWRLFNRAGLVQFR